ncbi:MAG: hypothetical protein E6J90_25790 [Deltaproteobacteria bacterium]|nr:MAG: hypothetical protein E6J90_25790 [Deltaproteobacteria bacterium]
MLRPLVPILPIVVLVTVPTARAGACPPAVALAGDPELVRAVRDQLDARGIAPELPSCPAVRARIEHRGAVLVVGIDRADGPAIERAVTGPATAATVIESWTRRDVAEPLLATRAVPADEPAVAASAPPPAAQGIQLFAAEETSLASDRTVWGGMQIGACIMLGPICAAARVHGGKVMSWPASWSAFSRKGAEVYAGVDVPIAVRWTRLTLGFAAGYGSMFTRHHGDGENMGIEISGPRAEVHATLSLPLTAHIAIDVAATGELTQATGMETHGPDSPDPSIVFPDEPRALFRLAIGVRYGAL